MHYLTQNAFQDKRRGETVNLVKEEQVRQYLEAVYGTVDPNAIPPVEKGLVLLDSRGQGSLQHEDLSSDKKRGTALGVPV